MLDLYLRCKKAPRTKAIEKVIRPLGWQRRRDAHWGKLRTYFWFNEENHESIRGCWLFVDKPQKEDPKGTRLVFCTTTYASRSYEDLEAQNNVIRMLRRVFGGSVYNSQDENSSYLHNDVPRLSPAEKVCGFTYIDFQENLLGAASAVSDIPKEKIMPNDPRMMFLDREPSIVRNNALLPLLVSILETFLRDFFVAYVQYHPDIQERIYGRRSKLEYSALKRLLSGETTLAEMEADSYTFQNLYSARRAYREYIDFDLFKVLGGRKSVKNRRRIVRDVIVEILELRHKIVHRAHIELDLDRERMETYIQYLRKAGELFAIAFLSERNFRIDIDEYL